MPELMVTLDTGETVRLADCDWVFYAACGCPRGCMLAVHPAGPIYDEDAAFRAFFDEGLKRLTEALVKRERKAGVTAVLMTRERWAAEVMPLMLRKKCPHGQQELTVEEVAADA